MRRVCGHNEATVEQLKQRPVAEASTKSLKLSTLTERLCGKPVPGGSRADEGSLAEKVGRLARNHPDRTVWHLVNKSPGRKHGKRGQPFDLFSAGYSHLFCGNMVNLDPSGIQRGSAQRSFGHPAAASAFSKTSGGATFQVLLCKTRNREPSSSKIRQICCGAEELNMKRDDHRLFVQSLIQI